MYILANSKNKVVKILDKKPKFYKGATLYEVDTIPEKYDYLTFVNGQLIANFYSVDFKLRKEKIKRIKELKQLLFKTDYIAIKYSEGLISAEEYSPIKVQRQTYRNEINNLEKSL